jgi:CDP-diglyceride synthetase
MEYSVNNLFSPGKQVIMWKKVVWVYLAIYSIGVSAININEMLKNPAESGFNYSTIITFLFFLLPAILVACELLGQLKHPLFVVFHMVAFLFVTIMVLGIFNFNTVGLEMIGKALLFIPMLGCLGYYMYSKLQKKSTPAQSG